MRRLSVLFAVLFVVLLFGSDSPKGYDDATEANNIEGTWRLTEINGDDGVSESHRYVTYHSGTYTIDWNVGDLWHGRYKIEPNRKPPHLDLIPSSGFLKGQTIKGIYQLDGDKLRIAVMPGGEGPRPWGFNDKGVHIETYRRVK